MQPCGRTCCRASKPARFASNSSFFFAFFWKAEWAAHEQGASHAEFTHLLQRRHNARRGVTVRDYKRLAQQDPANTFRMRRDSTAGQREQAAHAKRSSRKLPRTGWNPPPSCPPAWSSLTRPPACLPLSAPQRREGRGAHAQSKLKALAKLQPPPQSAAVPPPLTFTAASFCRMSRLR